jgi:hypothetical protein
MGVDSRFDILREVGIDSRCGVGGRQGDALGDFAAQGLGWDHSYRLGVALDDDLGSVSTRLSIENGSL